MLSPCCHIVVACCRLKCYLFSNHPNLMPAYNLNWRPVGGMYEFKDLSKYPCTWGKKIEVTEEASKFPQVYFFEIFKLIFEL